MPAIALIQDGTEVGRQWFGDVVGHLQRCCERLSDGRYSTYTLRVFTDEDLGFLLDGIDPNEWNALVFASNSLNSGRVEAQLDQWRENVDRYIAEGGGIVVLHQVRQSLSVLLPEGLRVSLCARPKPRRAACVSPAEGDDVLLNFPEPVDWSSLGDLTSPDVPDSPGALASVELPSLYFFSLGGALPAKLKPVLTDHGEVIAARTLEHLPEKVVLFAMPLDWQEKRPRQGAALSSLLVNSIRYASSGVPRRLVWHDPRSTRNELLLRWLSSDGLTAVHPTPSDDEVSRVDRWLLSTVDVVAMAPEQLAAGRSRAELTRFLSAGGVVLTSIPDMDLPASRVTALVGRYVHRRLAGTLDAELRATDDWRNVDSAFDIRNIVGALSYLWAEGDDDPRTARLGPSELAELVPLIRDRLHDEGHREDLGSSIALAQTLAQLMRPEPAEPELVSWMAAAAVGRPFPVELHVRAVLSACALTPDPAFLADVTAELEREAVALRSPAPVVRLLEAIALLDQQSVLVATQDEAVAATRILGEQLARFRTAPDKGWISAEATAHIVLGLAALYRRLPGTAADARDMCAFHIATGAAALGRQRLTYEPKAKGVARLARVTHALIVADTCFPLGLQRLASLDWPDEPDSKSGGDRVRRDLTQHLALENERLRTQLRDLDLRLAAADRSIVSARLPSAIGQAAATLTPTVLLLAATWAVVAAIGWSSPGGLIANLIVLLSVVLTLLTGVFRWLQRRNLLLAPAERVRAWTSTVGVPGVSSLGKLKKG